VAESTDWCYPSGVAAVLETFLLPPRTVRELASASSPDELLSRARRSPVYADVHLSGAEDPMQAAEVIESALVGFVRSFVKQCPDDCVADVFLIEYDLRDLANHLKAVYCGAERRPVALSSLPEEYIDELIADLPRLAEIAQEVATLNEADEGPMRAFAVDLAVDGAFIGLLAELTAPLGSPLVDQWAEQRRNFASIEAVIRARASGAEPSEIHGILLRRLPRDASVRALADAEPDGVGKALAELVPAGVAAGFDGSGGAGALQELAARFDVLLEQTLAPARYVAFGAERVFAYLWQLFRENRNLRAALGGFAGRIEPELVVSSIRGENG